MDIESLRAFCKSLAGVKEDVKWGHDLCFLTGEKMFCVTGLSGPFTISFKVEPGEFEELTEREGIIPAPYVARYKWVLVERPSVMSDAELKRYIKHSYELISSKLPGKKKKK